MVLENRRASFNIENVTYKEIEKEYKRFSLKCHPDKGGDAEIFKAGNETWTDLKNKLVNDSIGLEDLKIVEEALLTHLATHP